jgi:hypothetical protein
VSLVVARSEHGSTGVGNQVRRRREGIQVRHGRRCANRSGSECSCTPTFQAQVWSARDRKPIRKTFPTVAGALAWRQETQVALRRGTLRAPTTTTLAEAAEAWLSGAEAGIIRTRSGDRYKPSALRSYRHALQSKLLPELGRLRLSAIRRNELQDLNAAKHHHGPSNHSAKPTALPLAEVPTIRSRPTYVKCPARAISARDGRSLGEGRVASARCYFACDARRGARRTRSLPRISLRLVWR